MLSNISILIPLQCASTRVKLKNIREFYNGQSLFDIKISQLISTGFKTEQIYISSESNEVKKMCDKKGLNYIKRPLELTGNSILQPDLMQHFIDNIPKNNNDILWVQVTQPLFNDFKTMLDKWQNIKNDFNSIIAVKTVKHHMVSEGGIPLNFNFSYWHTVSQNLPKIYEILWSAFLLDRKTFETCKYHIGTKPFYMPFDECKLIDIDTEMDFEIAKEYYKLLENKENKWT